MSDGGVHVSGRVVWACAVVSRHGGSLCSCQTSGRPGMGPVRLHVRCGIKRHGLFAARNNLQCRVHVQAPGGIAGIGSRSGETRSQVDGVFSVWVAPLDAVLPGLGRLVLDEADFGEEVCK